jgi:hypothetical protein
MGVCSSIATRRMKTLVDVASRETGATYIGISRLGVVHTVSAPYIVIAIRTRSIGLSVS